MKEVKAKRFNFRNLQNSNFFCKKFLLIFLILFLIFFLRIASSQEPRVPQIVPGINEENVEKLQVGMESLSDEESRKQYLTQEWGKMSSNNTIYGKLIKPFEDSYNKISFLTDPVFKFAVGMTPEFSWLFFLSLSIWITILIYIIRMSSLIPFFSKLTQSIMTVAIILVFCILHINQILAEKIVGLMSFFDTTKQLISIIFLILFIILLSVFSKNLKNTIKKYQKKSEEELNRTKLKGELDIARVYSKAISEKNNY